MGRRKTAIWKKPIQRKFLHFENLLTPYKTQTNHRVAYIIS